MKAPNKFLHNNGETYAYLNDFTDAIEALPMDLTRNFTLLREVDAKVSNLQHLISSSISNLLTNTDSFQETKSISSSRLRSLLVQIIPYADEKISVASSTRDAIKKHLKRLDLDFSLIENEIPAIIRFGSANHPAFSSNSNISKSETRKEAIATRRAAAEELNISNNSKGNHRENPTLIRKKKVSHINGGTTPPRFDTLDKDKKRGNTYEKIKSKDQNQQSQFQLRKELIKKTSEVLYKKIKGTLILNEDNIKWIELGKQIPDLDLQATPITSPRTMVKIIVKTQKNETISYIFTFISPKAQDDCNNFKLNIQKTISKKNHLHSIQSISDILTKNDFGQDIDLQQSLLKDNSKLMKTFSETVIKGNITSEQFWSTRMHLLRTYAVEKYQKKGPYNVLVTIRPQTIDNKIKLSLSREKIHDIFQQHPLIKHIYNKNVPPLSEDDFWGRFFLSRLCKKLRGEKLNISDPNDEILDKYIAYADNLTQPYTSNTKNISHFIDLTKNEHHVKKTYNYEPSIALKNLENAENNNINLNLNDLQKVINQNTIYLYIKDQKECFLGNDIFQENYPKKIKKPKLTMEFESIEQMKPIINNSNLLLKNTTHDILQQIKPKLKILENNIKTVIPLNIKNQVMLCHETANELLNQFWIRFLSNEETIISQLPQIVSSLKKTNNKIDSIIKSNDVPINKLEIIKNYFKPTIIAIMKALEEYKNLKL
ncbi:hypothetical protein PMAC_000450 [Pneumocystis sp. 'macacae']|nr:hypothetical protein PMAC_000450 [Pneumocystis sp. 'macacae']